MQVVRNLELMSVAQGVLINLLASDPSNRLALAECNKERAAAIGSSSQHSDLTATATATGTAASASLAVAGADGGQRLVGGQGGSMLELLCAIISCVAHSTGEDGAGEGFVIGGEQQQPMAETSRGDRKKRRHAVSDDDDDDGSSSGGGGSDGKMRRQTGGSPPDGSSSPADSSSPGGGGRLGDGPASSTLHPHSSSKSGGRMGRGAGLECGQDQLQQQQEDGAASIAEVYSAMLLGFMIQGQSHLQQAAARCLPGHTLEPVLGAIVRCLHFYNATGALTDASRQALTSLLQELKGSQEAQSPI